MLVVLKNAALLYFNIKFVTGVMQHETFNFCSMIIKTLCGHWGTCSSQVLLGLIALLCCESCTFWRIFSCDFLNITSFKVVGLQRSFILEIVCLALVLLCLLLKHNKWNLHYQLLASSGEKAAVRLQLYVKHNQQGVYGVVPTVTSDTLWRLFTIESRSEVFMLLQLLVLSELLVSSPLRAELLWTVSSIIFFVLDIAFAFN